MNALLDFLRRPETTRDAGSLSSAEDVVGDGPESGFMREAASKAKSLGVRIRQAGTGEPITITKGDRQIVIAARNYFYAPDMVSGFDYFFDTVEPTLVGALQVADYSKPSWHTLKGLDRRFWFTSLPEGWAEAQVYLDYLAPKPGEIVLDLGAYCGLSAATFSEAVGPTGRVISFEPDPENAEALQLNLPPDRFPNVTIVPAAICGAPKTLWFSCEGNMGSRVVDDPSANRDRLVAVRGVNLEGVMREFGLDRVDIVKMDIEGAEYEAIESAVGFLRSVRARWFLELHADPLAGGDINIARVRRVFEASGYMVHQLSKQPYEEYLFPLLYAEPIRGWPFPVA